MLSKEGGKSSDTGKEESKNVASEDNAWLLSRLVFYWVGPVFTKASILQKEGKGLSHDDLLALPHGDTGSSISTRFNLALMKYNAKINVAEKSNLKKKAKTTETADPNATNDNKSKTTGTSRISYAVKSVLGRSFLVAGGLKVINTMIQFTYPFLLNEILKFIEDTQGGKIDFDSDSIWVRYRGYWLSALLFTAMSFKNIIENAYFHLVYRAAYQSRVAITVAVYNKSLRLTNVERQSMTLGGLVNLMQIDATKIEMFIPQIHVLWDGIFQIVGYMTILYTLIGWPSMIGLALMILASPIQKYVLGKLYGLNRRVVKYTDTRIATTNEALQGIQGVKMYTWEDNFSASINKSRQEELSNLGEAAKLTGASRAYMTSLPGLVAVVSFTTYALTGSETVKASTLFAALIAFEQLRFPLLFYPMALANLAQAKVSATRVEAFLAMEELVTGERESMKEGVSKMNGKDGEAENLNGRVLHHPQEDEPAEIEIQGATIYWSSPSVPPKDDNNFESNPDIGKLSSDKLESDSISKVEPILKGINLRIGPNELCAVVGRVASGKSTLCSAILNETVIDSGKICTTRDNIAYASQTPWILNATIRENIIFGLPMDIDRYEHVLKVCQLTHDLDILDSGDLTEIGERGINLSGGQKHRVSVARAAYSNAEIVILDDPLSALDPKVATALFEDCIVKFMSGRTRLFVTNQLQFLQSCDTMVLLDKGLVLEQGTYDDLNATDGGEIQRLLNQISQYSNTDKNNGGTDVVEIRGSSKTDNDIVKEAGTDETVKRTKGNLIIEEERNTGAVPLSVYGKYLKAGGGYLGFCLVLIGYILAAANSMFSAAWITLWTRDATYETQPQSFYLGIYAGLAVTLAILTYIRTILLVRFGIRASHTIHRDLMHSIFNAPQSFFDTTPVGRILSRFSKDMYSIDVELVGVLDFFLFCIILVLINLGTIIYITPLFAAGIPPLGFMYFRFMNYFRPVSRESKRLESISRSPIYVHFSETLGGLSTIRAYGQENRFIEEFEGKVNQNTRATYCNKVADRWLAIRLEFIGAVVTLMAAMLSSRIAISSYNNGDGDNNFAPLAGLALTFAISITGTLSFGVRTFAQLEAAMNSCERILHYTNNIPQEAPSTSKAMETHASIRKSVLSPMPSPLLEPSSFAMSMSGGVADKSSTSGWPSKGAITLQNLKLQYRPDTPIVLKGLTLAIAGGERVGIVGRTGSGKSSLFLAILRLVEPYLTDENEQSYTAPILIDGIDTLRIGTRELRSKVGIIPQNPILFSGSIRSNMDPFDQYSDDQVWNALDKCGMKKYVDDMTGKLSANVSEYGENLSSGMRQLLVLGRSLLQECRILLLDEATSSVDYETDKEIQTTLRDAFKDCTVLTIAHRIDTIMDSDKILVMKDGLAEEFAPPQELLRDDNSLFSEIVRHSKEKKT